MIKMVSESERSLAVFYLHGQYENLIVVSCCGMLLLRLSTRSLTRLNTMCPPDGKTLSTFPSLLFSLKECSVYGWSVMLLLVSSSLFLSLFFFVVLVLACTILYFLSFISKRITGKRWGESRVHAHLSIKFLCYSPWAILKSVWARDCPLLLWRVLHQHLNDLFFYYENAVSRSIFLL